MELLWFPAQNSVVAGGRRKKVAGGHLDLIWPVGTEKWRYRGGDHETPQSDLSLAP